MLVAERMNWGETQYIDRIEMLDTGELFLGIANKGDADYQYVYRETAGVYWDPSLNGFKSTQLKEWTSLQWFLHMVEIIRQGVGVRLLLLDTVQWRGISDLEKAAIEGARQC